MSDFPGRQIRSTTQIWIALFFWALALLIASFAVGEGAFGLGEHVLGIQFDIASAGLGVWLGIILFWWYRQRGRFDLFELPIWFSLNAYFQIIANVWLLQRDIELRSPFLTGNSGTLMVWAVILMGVGLTAMWGGYAWFTQSLERGQFKVQFAETKPRIRLIIAFWAITWLLGNLAVLTGFKGFLPTRIGFLGGNYLAFINLIEFASTFILMILHFRNPTIKGWVWLLIICSTDIILGLIIGTKSAAFIFLYIVMAISYTKYTLSKKWLLAGLISLVFVVPIVNTFRVNLFHSGYTRSQGAGLGARVSILGESIKTVIAQPFSSLAEETRDTFEFRQGGILEISAAIMAVHPEARSFITGEMMSTIVSSTIPRMLWPGKPTGHSEIYWINVNYLGAHTEYSLASPGLFSDAYRTGGWLLVILFFGLLGIFEAWLYWQGPRKNDLAGTAFYLVMLVEILLYSSHLLGISVELLQHGILLWIIIRFIMFAPSTNKKRTDIQS